MAAHQAPPSLGFSRQEHWSPEPKYLGQKNVQTLVERIYTKDTIFDNILENQMERAVCRDQIVKVVLKLLKKKRIVLL